MSPERLNGNVYGPAADVWSAGMIMLEVRPKLDYRFSLWFFGQ
jgi:serine/threonine protein kinase